jgi:hypothetical protein
MLLEKLNKLTHGKERDMVDKGLWLLETYGLRVI